MFCETCAGGHPEGGTRLIGDRNQTREQGE